MCVCMGYEPDKWILSNYSKIHSSIPSLSFPHSPPPSPLFLHSQALSADANQVPKPIQNQAMKSKAKNMLDEFVYQWKRWYRSFLMVCNCNTAWCLKINYEGGRGKGKTQRLQHWVCCCREGGIKQGEGGRRADQAKNENGQSIESMRKTCCLSVNGIGSPHG